MRGNRMDLGEKYKIFLSGFLFVKFGISFFGNSQ